MTCKDCIHNDVCEIKNYPMLPKAEHCKNFKDKSLIVELPCEKGDILNYDGKNYEADHWNILLTAFTVNPEQKAEKMRLFSVEEAEKALRERES